MPDPVAYDVGLTCPSALDGVRVYTSYAAGSMVKLADGTMLSVEALAPGHVVRMGWGACLVVVSSVGRQQ